MQKFKIKLKHKAAEALLELITKLVIAGATANDDKLVLATLAELACKLEGRLNSYKPVKPSYGFEITVAQAIAIVILSSNYGLEVTSYLGNALHQIANQIKQQTAA